MLVDGSRKWPMWWWAPQRCSLPTTNCHLKFIFVRLKFTDLCHLFMLTVHDPRERLNGLGRLWMPRPWGLRPTQTRRTKLQSSEHDVFTHSFQRSAPLFGYLLQNPPWGVQNKTALLCMGKAAAWERAFENKWGKTLYPQPRTTDRLPGTYLRLLA